MNILYHRLSEDNIGPNNEENSMCAKDVERLLRQYIDKLGVTFLTSARTWTLMNMNSLLLALSTTLEFPLPSHLHVQYGKFYCSWRQPKWLIMSLLSSNKWQIVPNRKLRKTKKRGILPALGTSRSILISKSWTEKRSFEDFSPGVEFRLLPSIPAPPFSMLFLLSSYRQTYIGW